MSTEAEEKRAHDLQRLRELRVIAEQARLAADQAEATLLNTAVELMLDRVLDPQGALETSEIANASGLRSRTLSKAAGSSPRYSELLEVARQREEA
ncbi:hypothetical protein ACFXKW_38500 [Streptomyces sp. NPDC059193]|uniref:hypothetical protein n=1 Tax=Streptomyces sp. NPDC059193 TaxID=3346763 RepID=UPI0036C5CD0E